MNNILTYILELNIALSLLFLFYIVIFRKDSNFNTRRTYLFISMIIALVFPLLRISTVAVSKGFSSTIISLEEVIISSRAGALTEGGSLSAGNILLLMYVAVSLLFILRLLFISAGIVYHALASKRIALPGASIRVSSKLHASSFFNLIFLDPDQVDDSNRDHILKHEIHHVKLFHSLDRIISEIVLAFSWVNPVAWYYRKSVITNHEYQADNKVITYGTDKVSYQLSILNTYIGSASISNQFSSQIKNRIIMLNKNYRRGGNWKSLLLIPLGIVLFFIISCTNEKQDNESDVQKPLEEEIFYVVDEMPQWEGGGDMSTELRKFVATNLIYPKEASENSVQGKVFIHFIVTKTGEVKIPDPSELPPAKGESGNIEEVVVVSYRPINSEDPIPNEEHIQLLKDEGIRVISSVPKLVPGKQRGQAVNVVFTIPITFALK